MRRVFCTVPAVLFCCATAFFDAGAALGQNRSPAIPHVLPEISWKDAPTFAEREVQVVGRVVRTDRSKAGHAFLNFDKDYRRTLTIFINKDNYAAFPEPPERFYRDKTIRVRGYIYPFKEGYSLSVGRPESITVLPDATPLPPASKPAAVPTITPRDVLTLACYNVLNLFDDADDPYTDDETTPRKPRQQVQAVAGAIRAVGADVLALCEVENRGILERFVDAYLSDMGYRHVALVEGNDRRGIDVAVLSRVPLGQVTSYRHLEFPDSRGQTIRFQRDLLRVRVEPAGSQAFDVFVVHLKSKGGDDNGGIETRLGEARAIRRILDGVLAADAKAPFMICGDFNDDITSEPLKAILGSGATALTAFVSDLSPAERITYNQPPHLSMIDFILASPTMTTRYVPRSYRVMTGGSPDVTGSDHNPVIARFRLQPP